MNVTSVVPMLISSGMLVVLWTSQYSVKHPIHAEKNMFEYKGEVPWRSLVGQLGKTN